MSLQLQNRIKNFTSSAISLTGALLILISLSPRSSAEPPPKNISVADYPVVTKTLPPAQVSPDGAAEIDKEIKEPSEGYDSSSPDNKVSPVPAETDSLDPIYTTPYPPSCLPKASQEPWQELDGLGFWDAGYWSDHAGIMDTLECRTHNW